MNGLALGFYLIPGMMLGIEIQRNPENDNPVLVFDLLIVRLMFEALIDE